MKSRLRLSELLSFRPSMNTVLALVFEAISGAQTAQVPVHENPLKHAIRLSTRRTTKACTQPRNTAKCPIVSLASEASGASSKE